MAEKVILAIVGQNNADHVVNALVAHQYSVTRLSSTGGFLRRGYTTLIIGVDESQLKSVLDVIRFACHDEPPPDEHKATLFVLNAEGFEHI